MSYTKGKAVLNGDNTLSIPTTFHLSDGSVEQADVQVFVQAGLVDEDYINLSLSNREATFEAAIANAKAAADLLKILNGE